MALYTATPPEGAKQKIWGHLAPYAGENYPTQYAGYMKGGYRSVATITVRNAIPASHRKHGMKVYCKSDNNTYRLQSNLTTWTLIGNSTTTTVAMPYTKYEYTPVNDMERITCIKWLDGRLEYFLRTKEGEISSKTDHFYFAYRYHFSFNSFIKFIREPVGIITGLSSRRTNADDITWGTVWDDINDRWMDIEAFTRDYETHAKQTIHVVGRWK